MCAELCAREALSVRSPSFVRNPVNGILRVWTLMCVEPYVRRALCVGEALCGEHAVWTPMFVGAHVWNPLCVEPYLRKPVSVEPYVV